MDPMTRTARPLWTSRPEHLGRIYTEGSTLDVRPASVSTGQSDHPSLDGIAILVTGQARLVLTLDAAWKLSDQLVDVIDSFRDDQSELRRYEQVDANLEPEPALPSTEA